MAVYKVPQDVEAEDKLIGPFSFRQFIYLMIVGVAITLAWFMSQIFIGLVLLPLPVILFFGALALPLKKDQPMEIYLAALVKFYFKPKKRMWQPEGQFSHVTITAPNVPEEHLTKDYGRDEAGQRLSYLANVIDTGGWSTRGVSSAPSSVSSAIVDEAANTEDVFDEVGNGFSSLIEQQEDLRKKQAKASFQQGFHLPMPASTDSVTTSPTAPRDAPEPSLSYNPYPAMHQHVVAPSGQQPVTQTPARPSEPLKPKQAAEYVAYRPPQTLSPAPTELSPQTEADTASTDTPSPDIMRLANNNDLSISAIAREAHRIEDKQDEDEVVITLR